MQTKSSRGKVLYLAASLLAFGSFSAYASLTPKETVALQTIAKACKDRQARIDDFIKRYPASAPFSDAMVTEGFALLSRPPNLPQAYWTIRDRAASYPIKDINSARDYSAMDGRIGQTEIACSGHGDSRAWRLIADRAIAAKKTDINFHKRFAGAWKSWVTNQINQPITYSQYTNIIETATRLAQRKLVDYPRAALQSEQQLDTKIHQAAPAKPIPLISNPQDPKWLDWAKMTQSKSRKERELLPAAQKSLSALAK
ncbi:MAG: hypothetical protein ACJ763_16460 [Bdellovibrionia bacterium]